jgi:hypothetical protein
MKETKAEDYSLGQRASGQIIKIEWLAPKLGKCVRDFERNKIVTDKPTVIKKRTNNNYYVNN